MYNFKKSVAAIAVAASLGFSASAFADTGALRIQVTDFSGKPVANADVVVSTPESLTSKKVKTDANGYVRVVGLDPSNKYQVAINGAGFDAFTADNVKVVSGKSFSLNYSLSSGTEKIEVTGTRNLAQIDTTSATVGMDITLDLTESLPTARNYQGYLQLAPGTKPSSGGNPSSKSGVNYSDIGGAVGGSTDNVYILDGINVTDNQTGTFGANINSEIIQEQQVLTGGIAAEHEGGSGLVTKVVTKSGGNEFHGSFNYYLQNDSLVGDHDHLPQNGFSTYDTAFTLGGPIIKDELWFFASYQKKNRETDVSDAVTGNLLRTVKDESDLGFLKLTWQPTDADRFSLSYFNDPRDRSGSTLSETPNNRDSARKFGGDNYKFEYSHSWDDLIVYFKAAKHESESSILAADTSLRNDVAYMGQSGITNADTDKGGVGINQENFRNRDEYKLDVEYFLDTDDFGSHVIKAGYQMVTNENLQNETYPGGARYTSIGSVNSGTTLSDYVNGTWVGETDLTNDDFNRILTAMQNSSNYASYLSSFDTNADGSIDETELANGVVFDSSSGNPTSDINVYRIAEVQTAPVKMKVDGTSFYVQDAVTFEEVTLNIGVRAEKWEHYASTGDKIAEFDWDFAPRLSAVWDINGDGERKVWGFAGRYYDPVRTNMTDFAGNLSGPVREEQVFIDGDWLTYRTRGGTTTQDAFFSPSTKTPYTDEFMLGYAQQIADDMSIEFTYTDRRTRNILEDYDLHLYVDALEGTEFHLPYSYFGYSENPGSNYVIGTLAGGKRDYKGYELTFKKHRTDNWMMYASYTYNDAQGNTNSDSNADFQGDVVWLDPRAPGQYGDQPGNVKHLFKAYGTYYFDNGVEIGAVYNWNSGTLYSETWSIYGRHLPIRVDEAYEYGGYTTRWLADTSVGSHQTPSYGTLDLRVKYTHQFDGYKAEFFLDIFNALDDQATISEQDVLAGDGIYEFGEANDWVEPRRFYLGAKISF